MNEAELSDREQEILKLVATGVSNKEIAQQLVISPNTVKVHLRNIFAKIGVVSRTEATLYAIRHGIVMAGLSRSSAAGLDSDQAAEGDNLAGSLEARPAGQPILGGLMALSTPLVEVSGDRRRIRWNRLAIVVLLAIILLGLAGLGIRSLIFQQQATAGNVGGGNPLYQARWGTSAALPLARRGLAATAYENHIYVIGGEDPQGVTGRVDEYTPESNSWKQLDSKPHPVTDVHAALLGEKIYVPGGRLANGQVTNLLEVFDPRHNTWETKADLPIAVSAYAMAELEGKLYLFGGWDGSHYLTNVYVYDPSMDAWQSRSPMVSPRAWAGAAVLNGKIYLIGGYDGRNALLLNEAYYPQREDDGENPWETFASLPEGRYAMGIASLVDTIYVVGGKGAANLPDQEFLPQTNQWLVFESSPDPVGEGAGMATFDNRIYVFGGVSAGKITSSNQVYQAIYTIVFPLLQK